ncbi:hypothetical protein C8T65DRAFT_733856 [Cerioporus squamosus]|nr:hypothetical protein C8T65DRAFT_733856 [Cerioporus squamosus]
MAQPKQKYYAVHNGRQGTQIYKTWEETKTNVTRVPNVIYKSFRSLEGAQAWLQGIADATAVDAPPPYHYPQGNQPVQQHIPPAPPGSAGPAAYVAAQQVSHMGGDNDDAMDVDNEYSDVEILAGPPSAHPQSGYYEEDSDIEILDGPPPDWGTPSRPQSRTPQRQQQPQAGPSRQATPRQHRHPLSSRNRSKSQQSRLGKAVDDAPAPTAPAGLLATGPVHDIQLSPDQLYVLAKVKNGESVFFTGSAGTGKSVLMREIIKHFGGRPSNRLGVTASTGIASINIGGCTLHSWAGIGLGKDDKDGLVAKIYGLNAKAYRQT